jgi:thiamine-phosphate pyrophosphorylase
VNSIGTNRFLYGIVDLGYVAPQEVLRVTEKLVSGGVDVVQLRAKNLSKMEIVRLAEGMLEITQPTKVPLIINDYPDLLLEVDADGFHLGQEDLAVAAARVLVGRPCIVGKSTHSIQQAIRAQADGADYIGFGPLFATATKPTAKAIGLNDIRAVHQQLTIPVFCIGGVKLANLNEVLAAGAKRVCIVSDLLLAKDIAKQAAAVKKMLESAPLGSN